MVFGPSVGNNRSGSLLGLIASWLKQRFTGGNMFNKKKAFTLSELLVVVIVLGVLAAVAVPKFTRVLETRKTTEAEGMLSAVRTEQEKRCTLGDEYSVKFASLPVAASLQRSTEREAKSANYTYTLNGSGMQAQSSGKDYTIKMLSRVVVRTRGGSTAVVMRIQAAGEPGEAAVWARVKVAVVRRRAAADAIMQVRRDVLAMYLRVPGVAGAAAV